MSLKVNNGIMNGRLSIVIITVIIRKVITVEWEANIWTYDGQRFEYLVVF